MNLQKTAIRKANKSIDKLNQDPIDLISLEFSPKELDDIMRQLIDANVPVQVFLSIDQKIRIARARLQEAKNNQEETGRG